jgi:acetyltransferase-like isoleucine patch superfamily enzyme
MRGLHHFKKLRLGLLKARHFYYARLWGMDIHPSARFSLTTKFDLTHPSGIHVGAETYIAFRTSILTHDMTRGLFVDTWIGSRCFIGAHSLIMPGVRIGDESIVAAGAIVTKDVPPRSIVAGNPARIVRENIEVKAYGRFLDADETERRLRGRTG